MLSSYLCLLESGGDQAWFTQVYRENQRRMTRLAAQLLGSGPRAEDAVHDAFMKLIQHSEELRDRPPERLAGWLAVVVKNTALDMLRRDRFETELEDSAWEPAVPADGGEFNALVELIRRMPEEYRRVLELRFVAEWSLAEIGGALGMSESAVKSRVFRGRRLLIEQLQKEGYLNGRACI